MLRTKSWERERGESAAAAVAAAAAAAAAAVVAAAAVADAMPKHPRLLQAPAMQALVC